MYVAHSLSEALSLMFILLVPGLLVLRLLDVSGIDHSKLACYAVAISIGFIFALGLTINYLLPSLGIHRPFDRWNVLCAVNAFVIALLCASVLLRRESKSRQIRRTVLQDLLNHSAAIAIGTSLVMLSCAGAILVNLWSDYSVMFLTYALFVVPLALVSIGKIPSKSHAILLFLVALSILLSHSLISNHVSGYDINIEYFYSSSVTANGRWDPSLNSEVNSMLSVVILAPALSSFCNLGISTVLKVAYPLIFAVMPAALYLFLRERFNFLTSYLACSLLMFSFAFYEILPQLARQEIAEVFFVAFLMILFDRSISGFARSFILIVLIVCIVVSHYAISYVVMSILALFFLHGWLRGYTTRNGRLKPRYLLLMFVLSVVWYVYTSGSQSFRTVLELGKVVTQGFSNFASPEQSGLLAITYHIPLSHEITRYLQISVLFLVVIGVLSRRFSNPNPNRDEYERFAFVTMLFFVLIVLLAYVLASSMSARMHHFILIVMSPFFVIGAMRVFNMIWSWLARLFLHVPNRTVSEALSYRLLAFFLGVFLLFNSGLVYELVDQQPTSIALGGTFDYPVFSDSEVSAAEWMSVFEDSSRKVYADEYRVLLLYGFVLNAVTLVRSSGNNVSLVETSNVYVFLGGPNVVHSEILVSNREEGAIDLPLYQSNLQPLLLASNQIYSNGGSLIFSN